jgi:hypothetical protein
VDGGARLHEVSDEELAGEIDVFLAEHGARRWQRSLVTAALAVALRTSREEEARDEESFD